ncbi:MAG: sugar ABC transporter substrate-binding protein [Eubacterium sp. 38_16]|nr:MAG: sugar ABC transporter substrate-binding protein [Eubacterium sp. 38_16]
MGDIKLKKGTGILFIMAVLFISSLLYLRYWDQDVLRVGIFYGSNWEVPGTVHYEILDKAIKKFKSKYPNIKVGYEKGILSDDYSEWLSEQILKGAEPDVYLVLDEDFHTLASLGALKNLDGVMNVDKEFKKEEFYSSVYKAGQYGGSQYALPMECNPTLMFVNKTLLQKEGIRVPDNDWTWDDFYRICEKMAKDSDGDGQIDQFGYYDYTWLQAVYSNGISPFNKKGTSSNFLDERFSQSLEFVKRLEETNRNYQVTSNDFDLGKVAFRPFTFSDYRTYMPYPWRIKKYSSFEWTCIRMPAGPSGDNRSEMSALMAGMSSRTGKKQAAWDFIKMLTTDEDIQSLIYEDTSAASVLKSVNTSKSTMNLLNKDTPGDSIIDMSLLDTVIDTGVIPYRFKDYTEAYEKTDNLIKGYVNEKDDSSTFLFQMKNQIDEILKK